MVAGFTAEISPKFLSHPAWITGILVGFVLDRFRMKYKTKLVNLSYFILFALLLALLIEFCLAVSNNMDKILRYG